MPTAIFGSQRHEIGSSQLGELRASTDIADDPAALRARLDEDGYLLIRGLYDPAEVIAARREVMQVYQDIGRIPAGTDPLEARIERNPPADAPFPSHGSSVTRGPAFLRLVEGPRVMRFFEHLFGEPSLTFDFKWLRMMGTGSASPAHFDNSYMGRGSERLLTVWTPVGDVRYEHGPLALIPGSHRMPSYAHLRETLGRMDVDRDQVRGDCFADPLEATRRFGGRWETAEFAAGDALIFGMFTLHASCENTTDRFRLSSDTRYQPASEPTDERWMGAKPKGHYAWFEGPGVPMEAKKREWGI